MDRNDLAQQGITPELCERLINAFDVVFHGMAYNIIRHHRIENTDEFNERTAHKIAAFLIRDELTDHDL